MENNFEELINYITTELKKKIEKNETINECHDYEVSINEYAENSELYEYSFRINLLNNLRENNIKVAEMWVERLSKSIVFRYL